MAFPQDPQSPDPTRSATPPLTVLPAYRSAPRPRSSLWGGLFRWSFYMAFLASLSFNALILILLVVGSTLSDSETSLHHRHHSGQKIAHDRIALIRIDGVLFEGLTSYAQKQIEEAAHDDGVKAVVVRINSPGGTITASDDLHKRLTDLHSGDPQKKTSPKHVVVSMSSIAASGGYYIAMPAEHIVAERTTITGSIGVYASFLNVADLADQHGVHMETIKAGAVKDSGSMFHHMTPQERKIWQDMVNQAYHQFVAVVEEGRPKLKGKLTQEIIMKEEIPASDDKGHSLLDGNGLPKKVPYTRVRADGGIFTAEQAKQYGLIDEIGYLEDAIKEAKKLAGLGESYEVISYDRPHSLASLFLGEEVRQSSKGFDLQGLSHATTPRLWFLAPQSDLAGLLAASRGD
jgi:protease IV